MKSLRRRSTAGFVVLALCGICFSTGMATGKDSNGTLSGWDNLRSLTTGQEIRVKMKNDTFYQGAFQSLSNDGITLRQSSGEQTLARKDILRVAEMKGQNHRNRNALIGATLGAVAGLGVGLGVDHVIWSHANCTEGPAFGCLGPPNPHWALIATPVLGAVGGAIGAAVPTGRWLDIYRAH